jgi:hypothetical protein
MRRTAEAQARPAARAGRRIAQADVFVDATNLLDGRYREIPGVDMAGLPGVVRRSVEETAGFAGSDLPATGNAGSRWRRLAGAG